MLNITTTALVLIHQALGASHVDDPAIYLIEATKLAKVSKDEAQAILSGADQATLRAAYERNAAQRPIPIFRLKPFVYPASNFPKSSLFEIQGISIFLPPDIAQQQDRLTLDVRDQELVLLDAEGNVIAPSALR